MRLRTYLFLQASAVALPVLAFALATTWWAAGAERAREEQGLARLAVQAANTVEIAIRERLTLARAFATTAERLGDDEGAIATAARAVHAATGIHIVAGTAEGRQIVNTTVPPGAEAAIRGAAIVARRAADAREAFLTDMFPRARGHSLVSVVGISARPPNLPPWAIVLSIEPTQLSDSLPTPAAPGGFVAVFDGAGVLVARAGDGPPTAGPMRLSAGERSGPQIAGLEPGSMHLALAQVSGTGWRVAVGVPADASPSPAATAIRWIATGGVVGLVLAVLLAALLARFLLRRARALVSAAETMTEPAARLPRPRIREFDVLGGALAAAARGIRERAEQATRLGLMAEAAAELEATVAERTAEVEQTVGRLLNAEDDERRRIARELHDSTVQELHAAALSVSAAQALIGGGRTAEAALPLQEARDGLDRAREELRTVAFLLQPPLLDELGLPAALKVYAEGFSRRTGLAISVQVGEWPERAPRAIETMLLRVAQEALANVHKHAIARTTQVSLTGIGGVATLKINDDGHGLTTAGELPGAGLGVGIPGMRARLRQLGGVLSIESGTDGTRLTAVVPFHQHPGHAEGFKHPSEVAVARTSAG